MESQRGPKEKGIQGEETEIRRDRVELSDEGVENRWTKEGKQNKAD